MGKTCCGPDEAGANNNDPTWRRILWIALGLNAIMFGVEIVAGIAADSRALQADALDFLGDAANYAISLVVAGIGHAFATAAVAAVVQLGGHHDRLGLGAAADDEGARNRPAFYRRGNYTGHRRFLRHDLTIWIGVICVKQDCWHSPRLCDRSVFPRDFP